MSGLGILAQLQEEENRSLENSRESFTFCNGPKRTIRRDRRQKRRIYPRKREEKSILDPWKSKNKGFSVDPTRNPLGKKRPVPTQRQGTVRRRKIKFTEKIDDPIVS